MNSMVWVPKHPRANPEMLGYIPDMISDHSPLSAREQFDDNYRQGGGWRPFKGHTMLPNGDLSYPGDPPTKLLYETKLHKETIRVYDCSWVAIIQEDGSYEVARMD